MRAASMLLVPLSLLVAQALANDFYAPKYGKMIIDKYDGKADKDVGVTSKAGALENTETSGATPTFICSDNNAWCARATAAHGWHSIETYLTGHPAVVGVSCNLLQSVTDLEGKKLKYEEDGRSGRDAYFNDGGLYILATKVGDYTGIRIRDDGMLAFWSGTGWVNSMCRRITPMGKEKCTCEKDAIQQVSSKEDERVSSEIERVITQQDMQLKWSQEVTTSTSATQSASTTASQAVELMEKFGVSGEVSATVSAKLKAGALGFGGETEASGTIKAGFNNEDSKTATATSSTTSGSDTTVSRTQTFTTELTIPLKKGQEVVISRVSGSMCKELATDCACEMTVFHHIDGKVKSLVKEYNHGKGTKVCESKSFFEISIDGKKEVSAPIGFFRNLKLHDHDETTDGALTPSRGFFKKVAKNMRKMRKNKVEE